MKCEHVRMKLVAFLRGDLSQREGLRVASHVHECPACFDELDSLQLTTSLLERLPEEHPSPAFEGKLLQALQAASASLGPLSIRRALALSRRRRRAAWAPVSLAALMPVVGLAIWACVLSPGKPGAIGQVVRVSGHPEIRVSGRERWRRAQVGAEVSHPVELRTSETDLLEIELAEGSRIELDFGTTAEIVKPEREDEAIRSPRLRVHEGKVWLLVTQSQLGLVVETPGAEVEALGTLFSVSVSRDVPAPARYRSGPQPEPAARTMVTVLRGKVRLSNQHGSVTAGGESYTEVTLDRPPQAPRPLEHLETIRLQAPWGQTFFEVWVTERLNLADAAKLIAGQRGWLGVEIRPAPAEMSEQVGGPAGASVVGVVAGSPAESAGVRPGDRLLRVGALPIRGPGDLAWSALLLSPGEEADLLIRRKGQERRVRVTMGRESSGRTEPQQGALAEGNRLLAAGKTAEAERRYREVTAGLRDRAAARNNLGVIHELSDQIADAISCYGEAVRLHPHFPLYRFNLATGFLSIGNLPRAAAEFEAALAMAPKFPGARFALGRTRAFLGDYAGADQQARALQSSPATEAQGCCLKGEILRLQGISEEAAIWYLKAAEADPFYVDAPVYLAAVRFIEGKLDSAREWTERALTLEPESLRALNRLGLVLIRQGKLGEAEEVLLKAAAAHPYSPGVRNNLGLLYLKKGDLRESEAAYRQAVRLAPEATYCHLGLAVALERSGQLEEAKQEYANAMRLDPTYQEPYERLAALHRKLGEVQLAQGVLDKARAYGL